MLKSYQYEGGLRMKGNNHVGALRVDDKRQKTKKEALRHLRKARRTEKITYRVNTWGALRRNRHPQRQDLLQNHQNKGGKS